MALASVINFNEAQHSVDVDVFSGFAVGAGIDQRRFALAVASVSGILTVAAVLVHIDNCSSLRNIWKKVSACLATCPLFVRIFT